MNVADSERIMGQLEDMGVVAATEEQRKDANVVILNTCSIRDHAEQKVRQHLLNNDHQQPLPSPPITTRHHSAPPHHPTVLQVYSALGPHSKRKRDGAPVAIVVAGCVAQQEGEKLLRRVPEVTPISTPCCHIYHSLDCILPHHHATTHFLTSRQPPHDPTTTMPPPPDRPCDGAAVR